MRVFGAVEGCLGAKAVWAIRVEDGWGYRSSILCNYNIGIAAAIPILQSPVLCKSWGRMVILQFHSA